MGNSSISFRRAALVGLAAFLGAVAAVSCESLENVDKNVCGNRVLETGEDCDGNAVPEEDAGDAGTTGPTNHCSTTCRYVCNLADDPNVVCPDDFGCGIDGTCRRPGGLSTPPLSIAGGGVRRLLSGDFDGDGRKDAVALGDSSLDILFFETTGLIERSITVPNERRLPGIGDIDGDGTSDLVLNLGTALGVLSGQDNRTLLPRSYHSGDVDGGTIRLVPLGRIDTENTLLAFVTKDGQTHFETIAIEGNAAPVRKKVGGMQELVLQGTLVGAVAVSGNTKGGAKCPVVAFELASPSQVVLLSCGESGKLAEDPTHTLMPLPVVGLPWAGAFFADADDDGDDDLLVGTDAQQDYRLHFLANDGNGKFTEAVAPEQSSPLSPLIVEPGNCGGRVLAGPPLAVGDLDGNRALDVVDARGVVYNPYHEGTSKICDVSGVTWSRAAIADFNGDERPDLLAARSTQTILDVWSRAEGGELNTFTIPVEEPVSDLAVGDFDGDSVDDAVLRLSPPTVPGGPVFMGPSELLVLFGRPLAVPEAPLSLGVFEGLEHIAVGRMKGENAVGAPDLLDDLVVLSAGASGMQGMPAPMSPDKHFTIIEGNVGRRLLAPLSIKGTSVGAMPNAPIEAAKGGEMHIALSRFGVEECAAPAPPDESETSVTPSMIVARTDSELWIAGCRQDGTSLRIVEGMDVVDGSMLIAPVNYHEDHDAEHEALALFMKSSNGEPGLWVDDYQARQFDPLPGNIPGVDANLVLPNPDPFDVPSVVVDVDGNGQRDVVVLAQNANEVRNAIAIFWNDGKGEDPVDAKNMTLVTLPDAYFGPDMSTGDDDADMPQGIIDIAFPNVDHSATKELAVLTRNGLYLFSYDKATRTFDTNVLPGPTEPAAFSRIRGGQALLAIDVNSDGVDDLLVAEGQKLLLFLGKEAAR